MENWGVKGTGNDFEVTKAKAKITSANGAKGCLIYIHGLDKYMIRVYDKDHEFIDYDIMHCDLSITIDDEDAEFYVYEDGRAVLDHSRQTLGETQ